MNVETIEVGEFQSNCYIVWGAENKAIIIDPGDEPSKILTFVENSNLSVASYMLTHAHVDHISAIYELYSKTPAPIGIHPDDLKWAFEPENEWPPFYSSPKRPSNIERELSHGQKLSDGGLEYEIILTPGHSPGSVCFYFKEEKALFAGDTLFAGSIGRTDLPGGNMKDMQDSLRVLSKLPDDVKVFTGHGPSTTIGFENKNNFFMSRQEITNE